MSFSNHKNERVERNASDHLDADEDNLYEAIETLVTCNEELASAFTLSNTGQTLKQEQFSVFSNFVEQ